VADLAVAVTIDWLVSSVVHGSHGGGHRGVEDGSVSHMGVGVVADISAGGGQDSGDTEESLHVGVIVLSG